MKLVLVLLLFTLNSVAFADEPEATSHVGKDKIETLDFEADVIEGQKKTPELFLQLDVQKPDLSAVLYNRKSFNDYHAVDHKRRPWLSNPVVSK